MENLLERALIFINRWSYVFYGVGALGIILYFRRAREAFHQRRYTPFPIEREEASATLRDALIIMMIIIAIVASTFYIDRILLVDSPATDADQSFFDPTRFFATPTSSAIDSTSVLSSTLSEEEAEGAVEEGEEAVEESEEAVEEGEEVVQEGEEAVEEGEEAVEEGEEAVEEGTNVEEGEEAVEEGANVEETEVSPSTELSEVPPPTCDIPGVQISAPANGESVTDIVAIMGSANIDEFQFYQIEYGQGANPEFFTILGEKILEPVDNGLLMNWASDTFGSGVWTLRLSVVDQSGNFSDPCNIEIVIP